MAALHIDHTASRSPATPLRSVSAPSAQAARPIMCEAGRIRSFAKDRSLAFGHEIGFGRGGDVKVARLAAVLDVAECRISRAFSPHYRDTLSAGQLATLAAALAARAA